MQQLKKHIKRELRFFIGVGFYFISLFVGLLSWLVTLNIICYHAWNLEILYLNFLNFDFMVKTNQVLHRLVLYCLCIFFLMTLSITDAHLVTFHCRNVERSRLKITSKANNLVVLVLLPAFTCNCFTDPLFWDVAQTCRTGLESCIAISFEKWEETLVLLTYFCVNLTHDTAINVLFLPSPQKLTLQYLLLTEAAMKWLLTDHTDSGRVFQVTRFLS